VRSARARDLAHRLERTMAEVVERALEAYEAAQAGREPAASFYARLSQSYGTDSDLEAVLREQRQAHRGIEL